MTHPPESMLSLAHSFISARIQHISGKQKHKSRQGAMIQQVILVSTLHKTLSWQVSASKASKLTAVLANLSSNICKSTLQIHRFSIWTVKNSSAMLRQPHVEVCTRKFVQSRIIHTKHKTFLS